MVNIFSIKFSAVAVWPINVISFLFVVLSFLRVSYVSFMKKFFASVLFCFNSECKTCWNKNKNTSSLFRATNNGQSAKKKLYSVYLLLLQIVLGHTKKNWQVLAIAHSVMLMHRMKTQTIMYSNAKGYLYCTI